MKYEILCHDWFEKPVYVIVLYICGQTFIGQKMYTTRRAAVRGAKRAGGIEEVKWAT